MTRPSAAPASWSVARACAALGPNYFAPTLLIGADATMACSCEETFGPVVPVTRFESEADVIAAANATPFGLAAYFYSTDMRRIWRVADALADRPGRHQRRRARGRGGARSAASRNRAMGARARCTAWTTTCS